MNSSGVEMNGNILWRGSENQTCSEMVLKLARIQINWF